MLGTRNRATQPNKQKKTDCNVIITRFQKKGQVKMNKKKIEAEKMFFEVSLEIDGISMVLAGLVNQLWNNESTTLSTVALADAVYAVRCHLERISSDLKNLKLEN